MTLSTQLLPCEVSAISFKGSSEQPTIASQDTLNALKTAAHHLLDLLQPVAFPTETVYGLGALALNSGAASRIFATKGRPSDNPLIVHVSSFSMLRSLLPASYKPSSTYDILMKHFWPGALTLLFPRDPTIIPSVITAGQPTVAIRMPSHPVARALIAVANSPLAAPSANSSGKPSPTKAEHVFRDLHGKVGVIIDGGACGLGLESTVVSGLDCDGNLRVLRPGGVTVEEIERVLQRETPASHPVPKVLVHQRDYQDEVIKRVPTTPGMKYRHYSPAVPVMLLLTSPPPSGVTATPIHSFIASLKEKIPDMTSKMSVGVLMTTDSSLARHLLPTAEIQWAPYFLGPSTEPSVAAHRLFDGLLTLEGTGVDLILIEEVKEENEGLAVMNRVRKAAGESRWLQLA